jgi:hypothetical protein
MSLLKHVFPGQLLNASRPKSSLQSALPILLCKKRMYFTSSSSALFVELAALGTVVDVLEALAVSSQRGCFLLRRR